MTFTLILLIFQSCGDRYVDEEVIIKSIGDSCQGGTIAHLFGPDDSSYDVNKQYGLIVALKDQGGMDISWWNKNLGDVETKALGSSIGDGHANTVLILSVREKGNYAAKICADYEIIE